MNTCWLTPVPRYTTSRTAPWRAGGSLAGLLNCSAIQNVADRFRDDPIDTGSIDQCEQLSLPFASPERRKKPGRAQLHMPERLEEPQHLFTSRISPLGTPGDERFPHGPMERRGCTVFRE